jgi:tRNA dimethylallyltransferase
LKNNTLIVIGGPTGSGKTDLSIRLAQHFGAEIISADSRQVYKELPIGSAAPDAEQLALVKHHFIGSHSIHEHFNAGIFADLAEERLQQLFLKNPIQIVCGGSGLYIKALLEGMDQLPDVPQDIRTRVMEIYTNDGLETLQKLLVEKDPEYAAVVDMNNKARLMRALELIETTGEKYSSMRSGKKKVLPYRVLYLCTSLEREKLYRQINLRTPKMLEAGWITEAEALHPFRTMKALQTVGYTELFDYLEGKFDFNTAVELIQQNTRRYAKRQVTWFKHQSPALEISPDISPEAVEKMLDQAS